MAFVTPTAAAANAVCLRTTPVPANLDTPFFGSLTPPRFPLQTAHCLQTGHCLHTTPAQLTIRCSVVNGSRAGTIDESSPFAPIFRHVLTPERSFGRHLFTDDISQPRAEGEDELWEIIREEVRQDSEAEPALASYFYSTILAHSSFERALAFHLANKLQSSTLLSTQLFTLFADVFFESQEIRNAFRADLRAIFDRDPACRSYSHALLNFKGYSAIQVQRVAHWLWNQGREGLAVALQSRVSEVFHVDIHPGAKLGKGVLIDHATGVVVGETAEIGNNVSVLHHVTLGGTGAMEGDRHPKVGDGVLIGAGATLLGPIRVGEGVKIGAGSVVLLDVPPHVTVVGIPARIIGGKEKPKHLKGNPGETMDHTSFILDYII